jgi:hypothetical protein
LAEAINLTRIKGDTVAGRVELDLEKAEAFKGISIGVRSRLFSSWHVFTGYMLYVDPSWHDGCGAGGAGLLGLERRALAGGER